jgi:hypothetical protein
MSDIVIYEDGNIELKVEFDGDTAMNRLYEGDR